MGFLEIAGIVLVGLFGWMKLQLWRKSREIAKIEAEAEARKSAERKMVDDALERLGKLRADSEQKPIDVDNRKDFE